jgi:hypothetical protein
MQQCTHIPQPPPPFPSTASHAGSIVKHKAVGHALLRRVRWKVLSVDLSVAACEVVAEAKFEGALKGRAIRLPFLFHRFLTGSSGLTTAEFDYKAPLELFQGRTLVQEVLWRLYRAGCLFEEPDPDSPDQLPWPTSPTACRQSMLCWCLFWNGLSGRWFRNTVSRYRKPAPEALDARAGARDGAKAAKDGAVVAGAVANPLRTLSTPRPAVAEWGAATTGAPKAEGAAPCDDPRAPLPMYVVPQPPATPLAPAGGGAVLMPAPPPIAYAAVTVGGGVVVQSAVGAVLTPAPLAGGAGGGGGGAVVFANPYAAAAATGGGGAGV